MHQVQEPQKRTVHAITFDEWMEMPRPPWFTSGTALAALRAVNQFVGRPGPNNQNAVYCHEWSLS
jgi:hypothetical protein